jgi:hypothetical protein
VTIWVVRQSYSSNVTWEKPERTWCMPKNRAMAKITPVYHGKIVRVINIKNKNKVGRRKIRILEFL